MKRSNYTRGIKLLSKVVLIIIIAIINGYISEQLPEPAESFSNPAITTTPKVVFYTLMGCGCLILLADLVWQIYRESKKRDDCDKFMIVAWLFRRLRMYYTQFVSGINQIFKRE